MATLSEGLEWMLKANTSQLNKGIDDGKKKVKELETQTKKSTDSMGKGFLKTKEAIEKVKGATLFYGAALVALVARAVQMSNALTKMQTAATLVGQKIGPEGLTKQVKAAAAAMGTSFASAANQAADVMTKYQASTTSALAAVTAAFKTQKIGIASQQEALQSYGQVARAFGQDIGVVAETLGPKMAAASQITGASLGEISGAVAGLAPQARQLGVSTGDLVVALTNLGQRGLSVSASQEAIATAMAAAINPTDEQRKAFEQLGMFGYNTISNVSGPNFLSFMATATNAAQSQGGAVTELLGSTAALNLQYSSNAGPTMLATSEKLTETMKKQSDATAMATSDWDTLSAVVSEMGDILATKVLGALDAIVAATEWLSGAWKSLNDFISGAWDTATMFMNNQLPTTLGFATGGSVPGAGTGDTVPAMLTPGEFVVKKSVAQQMRPFLHAINSGGLRGYAYGGFASPYGGSTVNAYKSADPIVRALARFGSIYSGGGSALLGRGSPLLGAMQGSSFNASPFASWRFGMSSRSAGPGSSFSNTKSSAWRFGMSYRFANGGDVPYASASRASVAKSGGIPAGAPIGSSYSISAVNVNMRGADVTPTMVRDRLLPAIQRETVSGRSRWNRTRR